MLLQKNGGALLEQKSTIIEELKQSMDGQGVHGVRKMKEERLRMEEEKVGALRHVKASVNGSVTCDLLS